MSPSPVSDKESGRKAVEALAEAFGRELAYYKSAEFDETTNRQRFIDPFFAALGWDVADEVKRGAYADVILEYSLKQQKKELQESEEAEDERIATAVSAKKDPGSVGVRRPDYSFRINGERQFFVEAKRPSVDIASPRPIFQVKSYGWSASTPIALLTDFEELLVFDCRYKPVLAEPLTGLLPEFRLKFTEYAKNWDLLWDTFSREAVAAGSLASYVSELEGRKGQQPVDVAFLADLTKWRLLLARDFAANNKSLSVWQLNEVVQLTLDRLVFIRVCEDRRLEPEVLRGLLDVKDPYPEFIKLLVPLNQSYNGGLLHTDFADNLKVSATAFKTVLKGLYTPWSPYRFDALGVEILGSIYERALGSIIELGDDRKVTIEPRPEVRKSGGVYYTPQWVVDEIIRQTIDPLIAGKAPRALSEFRVLDPACGSGSFLIAAFSRLVRHFEEYYTEHPTVSPSDHFEDEQGIRRLTAKAKGRILTHNIFGVDIDPAATEVTSMSLYLKSLETDAPEFVRSQMSFLGALLPSLVENIKVGNSLVSTDYYAQAQLEQLDAYEEYRLRPFKWESKSEGFGDVLANGGFDVVIGNPPYFNVDSTYGAGHPVASYLKEKYPDVWADKTDIYYYFLRRATGVTKTSLGFIVSRAFLEAHKARKTRGWLAENTQLKQLTDFGGYHVFAEAGIATAITVFSKSPDSTKKKPPAVEIRRLPTGNHSAAELSSALRENAEPFEVFEHSDKLGADPWRFANPEIRRLYQLLDDSGDSLSALTVLGQGMQTGANGVFGKLSDADVAAFALPRELLKKRARNSDIEQFHIGDSQEWLLYLEDETDYRRLPEQVRKYLELPDNQDKLRGRAAFKRKNCEWWKFTWPLHKELYNRPRFVSPYRTGHNRFALDEDFTYLTLTDTTVGFQRDGVKEDLRYVIAVLNSKPLTFRFRGLGKLTSENMYESFENSIRDLPVRRIDFSDNADRLAHDELVNLHDRLTAAHQERAEAESASEKSVAARRIEALNDQLDELVLDLYGVTDHDDRANILALGAEFD